MVFGYHAATPTEIQHIPTSAVHAALSKQHYGDKAYTSKSYGVGIVVDVDRNGFKYVRLMTHGGPADLSGKIKLGDKIMAIDGQELWALPLREVRELISTAPGVLHLTFRRRLAKPDGKENATDGQDTPTSGKLSEEEVAACEREFTVSLDRCLADDCTTVDLLKCMIYTKGHGSFLRGNGRFTPKENRRWIALRSGRIVIAKGLHLKVAKTIDIRGVQITELLKNDVGGITEYYFGLKRHKKPTLYFGDQNADVVVQFMKAVKEICTIDAAVVKATESAVPQGFMAPKSFEAHNGHAIPSNSDYGMLR